MERNDAEYVVSQVNESLGILNALLFDIESRISKEEYAIIKRAVAKVMNTCDSDVSALIKSQYPDINPYGDN